MARFPIVSNRFPSSMQAVQFNSLDEIKDRDPVADG
jgi:hypothetical protein